jgi:iron complex outermembrane receptor protein
LGASALNETALRYAKAFNNKFAFKVNVSYMQGKDWQSDTRKDQNPYNLKTANPGFPPLTGTIMQLMMAGTNMGMMPLPVVTPYL